GTVAMEIQRTRVNGDERTWLLGNNTFESLCGDVDAAAVADTVAALTPVPGGVGTVTTSVLLKHTLLSALRPFGDSPRTK
ncbi:MAG: hypothetical protein IKI63_04595, partial [Clostridia bacterium]|nr:hypothetical protein [Clostridia bacterium]